MGTERRERQKANRQLKQAEAAKYERRSTVKRKAFIIGGAAVAIFAALVLIAVLFNDDDNDDPGPTIAPVTAAVESTAAESEPDATVTESESTSG